jgi:hypothetical protein
MCIEKKNLNKVDRKIADYCRLHDVLYFVFLLLKQKSSRIEIRVHELSVYKKNWGRDFDFMINLIF